MRLYLQKQVVGGSGSWAGVCRPLMWKSGEQPISASAPILTDQSWNFLGQFQPFFLSLALGPLVPFLSSPSNQKLQTKPLNCSI